MSILFIPFIPSLSGDVIDTILQSLRDAPLALGLTSVKKVVLPAALSGIIPSVLLAASRGFGETMIVIMGLNRR